MTTEVINNEAANTESAVNDAQFMIQRIYVKGLSYETTNTPLIFKQQWEPELSLDINTNYEELEQNLYEVVLTVTATVKNKQTTAFLIEVQQAGIFAIQGAPTEQLGHLLGSFCPSILFPYAREAITAEATRGSFPQLVLAPINFDAIYMQKLQEQQKPSTTDQESTTH